MRQQCIKKASEEVQDCLIIGAGINGAVSAASLSARGAKVTVLDKGDFASFTSQESSNLAWGGIKYLETMEFRLVWKLCKSRNHLMKVYPNQIKETRFFTTISKGFRKPCFAVYLGALLYWIFGRFQTRPPAYLTRSAILRQAPMVRGEQVAGGLEYSDCRMVGNDARFTFGFVRKCLDQGGNAINYMELTGSVREDGIWRCTLKDQLSGEIIEVKARSLINAAGPFADRVNRLLEIKNSCRHVLSKGVHLIVPRITTKDRVMTFFATDGRLFFMIPMGNRTCIGTTDTQVDEEKVSALPEDIDFLLDNANLLLDLEKPLTRDDIIATRCGVRPLAVNIGDSVESAEWTDLSRKHEIDLQPDRNMLSIYGGKLTDCINVGNEVADCIKSFGMALPQTDPVWFGEPSASEAERFEAACTPLKLEPETIRKLWRRYGKSAFEVLSLIQEDPAMSEPLFCNYLRAEIHHIAGSEMIIRLEDFLRRRTMISQTQCLEDLRHNKGLEEVAKILFKENAQTELTRYFSAGKPAWPGAAAHLTHHR